MLFHIDEVDDDQPGEIAQAQLPRDFLGGFEIGLERGLFDVALARRAAGIHVDRDQRLGRVDDDVAAGAELHDGRVDRIELAFHLETMEERHRRIVVELHAPGMARHQHAHERLRRVVAFAAIDQHLVDVARIKIADRALDEIAFLIDEGGRGRFERQLADLVPEAYQIFEVARDLGFRALAAGGADDHTHAVRHFEVAHQILEPAAILHAGDLARDAAAARRVRHQHAIAAGQRDIGRQRRALVAALFLRDLHQHDLAALDHLLDLVVTMMPRAGPRGLFHLVFVAADRLDGDGRLGDNLDRRAFRRRRELGRVGAARPNGLRRGCFRRAGKDRRPARPHCGSARRPARRR